MPCFVDMVLDSHAKNGEIDAVHNDVRDAAGMLYLGMCFIPNSRNWSFYLSHSAAYETVRLLYLCVNFILVVYPSFRQKAH